MIRKIKNMIKSKLDRGMEEGDIEIEELREFRKEGAIIIDVRSPQEYKEGHIDGAIIIPEYEIKRKIENKVQDKNQNIVVYCSSGSRSKKAQKILKKLGYENVYNLYNGFFNYWDFYKFMLKFNY